MAAYSTATFPVVALLVETTAQQLYLFANKEFVPGHSLRSDAIASVTRVLFMVSLDRDSHSFQSYTVTSALPMVVLDHVDSYSRTAEKIISDDPTDAEPKFSVETIRGMDELISAWFNSGSGYYLIQDRFGW